MTPAEEIFEIVEKTTSNKFVAPETYEILSFPQLRVVRTSNTYSVRLKLELNNNDEIYIRRYENMKEHFKTIKFVLKNLIIEKPQSIVLSNSGKVVIYSPDYYDCIFTNLVNTRDFYCYNCIYYRGQY